MGESDLVVGKFANYMTEIWNPSQGTMAKSSAKKYRPSNGAVKKSRSDGGNAYSARSSKKKVRTSQSTTSSSKVRKERSKNWSKLSTTVKRGGSVKSVNSRRPGKKKPKTKLQVDPNRIIIRIKMFSPETLVWPFDLKHVFKFSFRVLDRWLLSLWPSMFWFLLQHWPYLHSRLSVIWIQQVGYFLIWLLSILWRREKFLHEVYNVEI